LYVYIPTEVVSDSAFPFTQEKGYVKIKIDRENSRLVIEKWKNVGKEDYTSAHAS